VTLVSRHEGKTLEFKRDLSSPEGVLKAIVAFANTSGGVIVLGVEDGTRKVKGVADVLAEEERLASLIADSISPKLVPSMEVLPWRKTQVLAVEIYPSPNRPHYLNRFGPAAGVFVRVGSTNRRADSSLIEEMRRYNQFSSFDEQPMPDLNSEAIDFRAASEYFKPIRKLTLHGLQSLKLTASLPGPDCANDRGSPSIRRYAAKTFPGCMDPSRTVRGSRPPPNTGFRRSPVLSSGSRGGGDCVLAKAHDSRSGHRTGKAIRPVDVSGCCDPRSNHERDCSCRLRSTRRSHPRRPV
jgi:hypothetical protein